jgi:hypothetical protein
MPPSCPLCSTPYGWSTDGTGALQVIEVRDGAEGLTEQIVDEKLLA